MQGGFRQAADEVHVVRDEYQCALVVLERLQQCLDGNNVEVGCRLVHEQEVWRVDEELHQIEARFLTS